MNTDAGDRSETYLDDIEALLATITEHPASLLTSALECMLDDYESGTNDSLPLAEGRLIAAHPDRNWLTLWLLQQRPKLLAHVGRCDACNRWFFRPLSSRGRPERTCSQRCAKAVRGERNRRQMRQRRGGRKRQVRPSTFVWCNGEPVAGDSIWSREWRQPEGLRLCRKELRALRREQRIVVICTKDIDPMHDVPSVVAENPPVPTETGEVPPSL